MNTDLRRVIVVGTSCSGKTTLARRLSELLDAQHIELDAIHWLPDWRPRPTEELRELVRSAVAPDCWVADGNYRAVRDIVWGRATCLIWLNYPFRVVFSRALRRTIARSVDHQTLFSGNTESLRRAFFSRESILLWVITTYRRIRREFGTVLRGQEYRDLNVIELRTQRETRQLLESLTKGRSPLEYPRQLDRP